MKYNSKEEFAKAIIDAGTDGLVSNNGVRVYFDTKYSHENPFRVKFSEGEEVKLDSTWCDYNRNWEPYVKPIAHKAFVWAWDSSDETLRTLAVYDAYNECLFGRTGDSNGPEYDNYRELTPNEIQPWMQELIDACEGN